MGRRKKIEERVRMEFLVDDSSESTTDDMAPKGSSMRPELPETKKRKMIGTTVAPATKSLIDQETKRYPVEPSLGRVLDVLAECVRELRQLQKQLRKRDWESATLILRLQAHNGEKTVYIRPVGYKARARHYITQKRASEKA